jgi:hypothetical protein
LREYLQAQIPSKQQTQWSALYQARSHKSTVPVACGLRHRSHVFMVRRSMLKPTSSQKKNAGIDDYYDRSSGKGQPIDFALLQKDRHLAAIATGRWPSAL